jgi:predicted CoA-binding protein
LSTRGLIEHILDQKVFAVTGVSRNPEKYGYQVYQRLKGAGYTVFAVNPNADEIEGDPCYPSLDNVPGQIDCVVTVTQPEITEETMLTAGHLRIQYCWMQPGAESTAAINKAQAYSMQLISGGPCIMVAIGQRRARNAAQG